MAQESYIESLYTLIDGIGSQISRPKKELKEDIYSLARKGLTEKFKSFLATKNGDNTNNSYFDINARNMRHNGRTVLHEATANGHLDLTKVLIEDFHADIHRQTYLGKDSALHLAVSSNHRDIVFYLLNSGADPNQKNKYGSSPLHYVKKLSIAKLLCHFGASTTNKNVNQKTPLDVIIPVENGLSQRQKSPLAQYLLTVNEERIKEEIKSQMLSNKMYREKIAVEEAYNKEKERAEKENEFKTIEMEKYQKWKNS